TRDRIGIQTRRALRPLGAPRIHSPALNRRGQTRWGGLPAGLSQGSGHCPYPLPWPGRKCHRATAPLRETSGSGWSERGKVLPLPFRTIACQASDEEAVLLGDELLIQVLLEQLVELGGGIVRGQEDDLRAEAARHF